MHAIRTTPGFVIDSRPYGEAGKILSIFTRELGLVAASAQGIRLERSKLRPMVQDCSLGLYSFVRGKDLWRLTSAQEWGAASANMETAARFALMLRRLLHGEAAHPELFDAVAESLDYLAQATADAGRTATVESLTVLRMLYALGYVDPPSSLGGVLSERRINDELVSRLTPLRRDMNVRINAALRASHL